MTDSNHLSGAESCSSLPGTLGENGKAHGGSAGWKRTRVCDPTSVKTLYVFPTVPQLSETFLIDELARVRSLGANVSWLPLHAEDGGPPGRAEDQRCNLRSAIRFLSRRPTRAVHWLVASCRVGRTVPRWVVRRSIELAISMERFGATHIHAHFVDECAIAVYLAVELRPCKWTATAHARDIFRSPPWRTALLAGSATKIVAVCNYNRVQLVHRGVPESKIVVIPCGVDVDRFVPSVKATATRELRIVAVGRLVPKKGFSVLVEAMAVLQARGVECRCVIIGEGPLHQELTTQIAGRHLESRFKLLGGLSREDVAVHLAESDVFCLPCIVASDGDRDSMPVAAKEAMACGLPIVATSEVGLPELVTPGAGYLVSPNDSVALADALEKMRAMGQRGRASMGAEARVRAERVSLADTAAAMHGLIVLGEATQRWETW